MVVEVRRGRWSMFSSSGKVRRRLGYAYYDEDNHQPAGACFYLDYIPLYNTPPYPYLGKIRLGPIRGALYKHEMTVGYLVYPCPRFDMNLDHPAQPCPPMKTSIEGGAYPCLQKEMHGNTNSGALLAR